jgi:phosphoglycerate dehydrogenase-like enzyme
LINKEKLALCKPSSYFINTGRGPCVNEKDMAKALQNGTIAGYATDVWETDPPESSPLFEAPNTLFAPHIGASSKENMGRISIIAEKIVSDYVSGTI